ncbi:MAG: hypothetical protein HGA45_05915 [Chloroflexales bacterium]|nr:hypothetical protein [Chloroflexales bacterium]
MSQAPDNASAIPLDRAAGRNVRIGRTILIPAAVLLGCACLLFVKLGSSPQVLPDEGSLLSLARTLAEDGVYAIRTSEGYQTYGIIQSIGPTVVIPVALSFKLFGVGLVQARVVAGIYAMLALLALYLFGAKLFGMRAALLAVLLTLTTPAIALLIFGRMVIGEIPVLAFFLLGCWLWLKATLERRPWLAPLAGLCFGAAAVTKSYYLLYIGSGLALVAALDLLVYRQRLIRQALIAGVVMVACWAAWIGWQVLYFGLPTFQTNAAHLRDLAAGTFQFSLPMARQQIRMIFGEEGGYFFFFWGIVALAYALWLAFRSDRRGPAIVFVLGFAISGFSYFLFFFPPWLFYIPGLFAISALFTGKLWSDIIGAIELSQSTPAQSRPDGSRLALLGAVWAVILLGVVYPFCFTVNDQLFSEIPYTRTAVQAAEFLDAHVDQSLVVETWERVMGSLTDHRYHYPDHGLGAKVNAFLYRNGPHDFTLGEAYFKAHHVAYLVWGVAATETIVYDRDYLSSHACVVAAFDSFGQHYLIYRLNDRVLEPGAPPCLTSSTYR